MFNNFGSGSFLPPKTEGKPPPNSRCDHQRLELYVKPCLKCNAFCNCRYTYTPKYYPDVLVRSVDKHIVRISGSLVRASATLSIIVDKFSGANNVTPLEEETVMIERGEDNSNVTHYLVGGASGKNKAKTSGDTTTSTSATKGLEKTAMKKSSGSVIPAANLRIRDSAVKMKLYKKAKLENEMNCNQQKEEIEEKDSKEDKVLTLFDLDSDEPTFGITRDTFERLDYYIKMHLNDVDKRVQAKKQAELDFFNKKYFLFKDSITCKLLEELDMRDMNTFQFEDWEEKFFDVSPGIIFDLHKANQELLIWDLYYAIEKWMVLFRGYPKLMTNGKYDIYSDPENDDKRNFFGLYGIPYPNPYRKSWHPRTRYNISHFNRVGFRPRWLYVNRHQVQ